MGHQHNHHHDSHHGHDHHGHAHHHDHGEFDFAKVNTSFVIAVGANLIFTIIEAVYGFLTNSVSLLGDAGHNLSDVLGLLLAWGAAYLTTLRSSDLYSYGYRRTTILAALVNALTLIIASGFIAYESIEKLLYPEEIAPLPIIIVAAIGIVVNAGTAVLFMKGSKHDLNLKGAYLHLAYDAAISLGVVIAGVCIMFTGWNWVDPIVGLLIVVVIVFGTWGLLKDSVNLILDAVPLGIERESVKRFLESIEGVSNVHDLHIWGLSTHENCLTAHLVMPENTLWDSADSYADISKKLQSQFNIHHVTLQVEKELDCTNNDCD